jgi:hypothetical protein
MNRIPIILGSLLLAGFMLLLIFVWSVLWLGAQPNRQYASFEIKTPPSTSVIEHLNDGLPYDPLIVFRQPAGYRTPQEEIDAFKEVKITLEVSGDGSLARVYHLGSQSSGGVWAGGSVRADGTFDYGRRFRLESCRRATVKLTIEDPRKVLVYPITVVFEKMKEF